MRRREVLGIVAITGGTIGCLGSPPHNNTGDGSITDNPTDKPPTDSETDAATDDSSQQTSAECDEPFMNSNTTEDDAADAVRTIEITSQDRTSETERLKVGAEVVNSNITEKNPGKIRVALRNQADRALVAEVGSRVPFSGYETIDTEPGLALLHSSQTPDAPEGSCWDLQTDTIQIPMIVDTVELAPCESVSKTFEVWNHPKNDSCLPRGKYRFESHYAIGRHTETDRPEFRWGFELELR